MKDNIKEKTYFGKNYRIIIDQKVPFSIILDHIKEKFEVKELSNQENTIILIEEKEENI